MNRVLLAETAVLAHFDTVRIVALILHRVVIALLALRAGQRDLHAHTSSSHTRHLLLLCAGRNCPPNMLAYYTPGVRGLSTVFCNFSKFL